MSRHTVTTADHTGLLCTVTALAIYGLLRNVSTFANIMDGFVWEPEDARHNIVLPVSVVGGWALILWAVQTGPFAQVAAFRCLVILHFTWHSSFNPYLQRFQSFEIFHNAALTTFSICTVVGIVFAALDRANAEGVNCMVNCNPVTDST